MKYKYTAINPQNQPLSGIITASDATTAKEELRRLGLSILSFEEHQENAEVSTKPRFEFEAIDKDNKKVIGSIPVFDEYEGYKRLRDEYKLNVLSLYPIGLPEEEKQLKKIQGVSELKKRYEDELKKNVDQNEDESKINYQKERGILLKQVDFTLAKVNSLIDEYGQYLPHEQTTLIKNLANKLLRVKNSANLSYIKSTCEELLKTFQEQERFLQEKVAQDQKDALISDTQKLLLQVQQIGITSEHSISVNDSLRRWILRNKESKNSFTKFLISLVKPFIEVKRKTGDPKIQELEGQIKVINRQLIAYLKLLLKSKSDKRKQILQSIKVLWQERKRLSNQRLTLKQKSKPKKFETRTGFQKKSLILQEATTFTGWLVFFYLSYYFLAHYFLTKNLPFEAAWNFNFYHSTLKYLIALVFIAHSLMSLKLIFFPRNLIISLIFPPIGIFLMLLVLFNF